MSGVNKALYGLLIPALLGSSTASMAGLRDTAHNLSAGGAGAFTQTQVTALCVFCHTPHNANPAGALWNRDIPGYTYELYDSPTSKLAELGRRQQPTGSSRLCLSCHDGTVALGNLRVPPTSGAITTLGPLTGKASLGLDLSDDHPVSFVYDRELALRQGSLVDPNALPHDVPLDREDQLQCTTCHDPHDDPYRKFLRMDDTAGTLCLSCHLMPDWNASIHARATATVQQAGISPWPADSPFSTVAEHACTNCHRSHAAAGAAWLLSNADQSGVCLACHDGSVSNHDVESDFQKASSHPIYTAESVHEPTEDPVTMARHVTCVDCHDPHQVAESTAGQATSTQPRGVSGVDLSGSVVDEATQEYEVCFKCHGVFDATTLGIVRQDNIRNVRLEISPANRSYHPVAAVGANPDVRGFETGYSAGSIIACTDCHNDDEARPGGAGTTGPHGSQYAPLLIDEYQSADPTPESAQSYALCYSCHNRNFLLSEQGGDFSHGTHVVDQQASCAVCHDAHGSRNNAHLINFMLADDNAQPVVGPSASGRLEYDDLGVGGPQCYLNCHGVDHDPIPN